MHLSRYSFVLFIFTLIVVSCDRTPVREYPLTRNWTFKHSDSAAWLPASVPGSSHLDLLDNGLIEDPFFGDNEQALQWIGDSDWEYTATFYGDYLRDRKNVELVFEGLDTYATVYLNDTLILQADNMFRTWEVDIVKLLKEKENTVLVRFSSPGKIEEQKASRVNYSLPEIRGFTRKAPYHYGWDWGPRFVTSGIWKPVYIRAWDEARIEKTRLELTRLDDSIARYSVTVDVLSSKNQPAILEVLVNQEQPAAELLHIRLDAGSNAIEAVIDIKAPQLWWPAGLGDQPLYAFDFILKTPGSIDSASVRTGIREVALVQERDSIGETFYFRINGKPVFMKGANYIPQDNFLTRVPDEKYEKTIQSALDANMNMLRVWGGGIYEREIFYDLCDEKGLLVWQDFMFACNMYPGDQAFLENVQNEAIEQVRRLSPHPSVVLWCGNNEVDEGWHNWGWQKALGYSAADSAEVWSNYQKLFHEILPEAVARYSTHLPYVSSSPRIGWGHEEALLEGDMHYWGVWWGEEPFHVYEQKVGRFMSEYGFQGFPDMKTLRTMTDPRDRNLESKALNNHQKHPRGMELIRTYMEREYPVPEAFDDFAYVSQLVQAYGIKTALEAHRRAKPRCMGTLYWQLNDCWPVISWSSVDYFGRWKALHYFSREIFRDYLVSFEKRDEKVAVYVISDKLFSTRAELNLVLMDFNGQILAEKTMEIMIPENSSGVYMEESLPGIDATTHLLKAVLRTDQDILAENVFYFAPVKQLHLPDPEIAMEVAASENGVVIRVSSPQLVKDVYLVSDSEGFFSNNFFDLMPNEPTEIMFHPEAGTDEISHSFQIKHLNGILNH